MCDVYKIPPIQVTILYHQPPDQLFRKTCSGLFTNKLQLNTEAKYNLHAPLYDENVIISKNVDKCGRMLLIIQHKKNLHTPVYAF